MAREAHLEAAKHHLDAASKHLAAVGRYNEGDVYGAERHSEEAWVASQLADGKSTEAHRKATMAVKMNLGFAHGLRRRRTHLSRTKMGHSAVEEEGKADSPPE